MNGNNAEYAYLYFSLSIFDCLYLGHGQFHAGKMYLDNIATLTLFLHKTTTQQLIQYKPIVHHCDTSNKNYVLN